MFSNTATLEGNILELVLELKQSQSQVERLLVDGSVIDSHEIFFQFEKLLRKTSEMEEFSSLLNSQQRQELRAILREATQTYSQYQEKRGIRVR